MMSQRLNANKLKSTVLKLQTTTINFDSSELTFMPTSKSHEIKLGRISKIRPDQIYILYSSLRIRASSHCKWWRR